MAAPRVCVLRAPGTNCDLETAFAFDACGGASQRVHVFRLLESPELLREFQVLCIPGGFSYGDDIGAGVIFGQQLRSRLGEAIGEFLNRDTLTLGICNGFQVLLKAGILPGGRSTWPDGGAAQTTLTWNTNGRYTCVWTRLRVAAAHSAFLKGIEELDLPVAHAEGRIALTEAGDPQKLQDAGSVALKYVAAKCDAAPQTAAYNPNGSIGDIAGLSDPSGRVLGLMPHPERFIHATQHPQWTRHRLTGEGAGIELFRNAIEYFR